MEKWIALYCNDLIDAVLSAALSGCAPIFHPASESGSRLFCYLPSVKPLRWYALNRPRRGWSPQVWHSHQNRKVSKGNTRAASAQPCVGRNAARIVVALNLIALKDGRQRLALALRRMQHAECAAAIRPHQHQRILTIRHG